jgi:hypothetical protein
MKEMWEEHEISTRNCYNALSLNGLISCRLGRPVADADGKSVSGKRVDARGVLFATCKRCQEFDNDWGVGK